MVIKIVFPQHGDCTTTTAIYKSRCAVYSLMSLLTRTTNTTIRSNNHAGRQHWSSKKAAYDRLSDIRNAREQSTPHTIRRMAVRDRVCNRDLPEESQRAIAHTAQMQSAFVYTTQYVLRDGARGARRPVEGAGSRLPAHPNGRLTPEDGPTWLTGSVTATARYTAKSRDYSQGYNNMPST